MEANQFIQNMEVILPAIDIDGDIIPEQRGELLSVDEESGTGLVRLYPSYRDEDWPDGLVETALEDIQIP